MTRPKWIVTNAVGGGFNVSAQAFAYPDRPDIMDGVAHFYNEDEANLAVNAVNVLPEVLEALKSLADCSPCKNGCAKNDMTCASNLARAALAKAQTVKLP